MKQGLVSHAKKQEVLESSTEIFFKFPEMDGRPGIFRLNLRKDSGIGPQRWNIPPESSQRFGNRTTALESCFCHNAMFQSAVQPKIPGVAEIGIFKFQSLAGRRAVS